MKAVEINGIKFTFDKEKTMNHRTDYNKPCDCQNCRNFYKNLENNTELLKFLADFGVDYNFAEEVLSRQEYRNNEPYIHSEGYYGVEGTFDGDYLSFERFGVKIHFLKDECVPHDREDEYFFIEVEGDFPFVLDEKMEEEYPKNDFIEKIKTVFRKK